MKERRKRVSLARSSCIKSDVKFVERTNLKEFERAYEKYYRNEYLVGFVRGTVENAFEENVLLHDVLAFAMQPRVLGF